jgi:hypothetical protein
MSSNDPVPVNSRKSASPSRRFNNEGTNSAAANPKDCSLIYLCRSVIIANLERYPPDSLGIVSEEEWESIIRLRHRRTSPKAGSGGLDGTGRIAPALSDRFLAEVEQANPQIAESTVVDQLVWKDCVEYKFKLGGMTRPKTLTYPWPILVEKIRRTGDALAIMMEKDVSDRDEASVGRAMDKLTQFPMNIALLKATGIGKSIKKIIKSQRGESESPVVERLNQLLTSWMDLAASNGIKIKGQNGQAASSQVFKDDEEDLRILENCPMWRHLFAALTQREEKRRNDQGKRMREKRKDRASGRPKVVKVRPASAKHDRILGRPMERAASMSSKTSPANGKMLQLRKEASVVASRQGKLPAPATMTTGRYGAAAAKSSGGFGAAVAFSSGSKKNSNVQRKKDGRSFEVGGGKRMKIPATAGQGASRNLVAKMKKMRK